MLQRLRENKWAFSFEVSTLTDRHVYTVTYRTLAEAEASMQQDHDSITALGQVASKIKVAHAALASANPAIHEHTIHLDALSKRIFACLATKVDLATKVEKGQDHFVRTQVVVTGVDDLPAVHAKHAADTAAHIARLAGDAEKLARLQNIGSVPQLGGPAR